MRRVVLGVQLVMRRALLIPFLALLVLPAQASARPVAFGKNAVDHVNYPGMQKLRFRYGPILIRPGQNTIRINESELKPKQPGFITRFEPNMVRVSDGKPPPVDLLHMHHVVWLVNSYPSFAAGEEKTIIQLPRGFGFAVNGKERWAVNDMLHNLIARPTKVYVTWEMDFVPLSSKAGQKMKGVRSQWMDVAGLKAYPVFDALKGWGGGRYTFPDEARGEEQLKVGAASRWRVPRDLTLIHTAGHLHPGGLSTSLKATREGKTVKLFTSRARYYEPAGPVSWDVSMTVPSPAWKVKLKQGDLVTVDATYDTSRASWYEGMGIMVLAVRDGHDSGGTDPFASPPEQRGRVTHGHLPENNNHGGGKGFFSDPRKLPDGPRLSGPIEIKEFEYAQGDMDSASPANLPPLVSPGQSLSFVNLDATEQTPNLESAYHTVTACKAPCTATTGLAYPLADGDVQFDSGQLGFGPKWFTSAANRNTWQTPDDLSPGTYAYFCRLHPFMRGSFRVKE